ncbi:hypothetical protein AB1Y20_003153 [Prymnesium parvum]|uniref:Thioredoxin-like fold domain-containing protein n=1 Tax=Prymnesium parvum TaxID=97485 RepID=A0AB34JBE0_PRYPA
MDVAALQELLEVKEARIESWATLAGGLGDESRALARAVEAATAGLKPVKDILALDDAQQAKVMASLSERGLTVDRLYDVCLFDDVAAESARVKLRREQERLKTRWEDVWSNATLMNALGDQVAAKGFLAGKHVVLLMAASWREACVTFVPKLMDFHAEVVRKKGAPLQIVLVSFDHSEAEMVRWMREPIRKKDSRPMPWLAAPYGTALHEALKERYNSLLRGLPTLILVSSEGAVVSNRAHAEVVLHGADAWERWYETLASPDTEKLQANAQTSLFDVLVDSAATMNELFTDLRGRDQEKDSGTSASSSCEKKQTRLALVHIGTDWSDGSAHLDEALSSPDLTEEVGSAFTLRRLCYETSQRWLMENAPSLHHGALPTLAAFDSFGKLLLDADLDDLTQDGAQDIRTGVCAFLDAAKEAAKKSTQRSADELQSHSQDVAGSDTDGWEPGSDTEMHINS